MNISAIMPVPISSIKLLFNEDVFLGIQTTAIPSVRPYKVKLNIKANKQSEIFVFKIMQ